MAPRAGSSATSSGSASAARPPGGASAKVKHWKAVGAATWPTTRRTHCTAGAALLGVAPPPATGRGTNSRGTRSPSPASAARRRAWARLLYQQQPPTMRRSSKTKGTIPRIPLFVAAAPALELLIGSYTFCLERMRAAPVPVTFLQ